MNSVSLIGRLTKDPDVRYGATSQMAVARFSIAINRQKDKNGEEKTDYPNIVCFGKTAELVEKYLGKGRLVGIQGRIQTGSYQDKDGKTVYTTEVVADRVEFLDRGDKGGGITNSGETAAMPSETPGGFEMLKDDDIPF